MPEDTIELIRRLAAHHPDHQIASILSRNGHRTGTGLTFTASRVRSARQRAGIPAAPSPDPTSELVTINQAAAELGASVFTIRRWLRDGLLPGEQVAPSAPGGAASTTTIAPASCPTSPTAISRSPTPPRRSAAPARPSCTRSNGASCTPSTSPADAAKGSPSTFPPPPWTD